MRRILSSLIRNQSGQGALVMVLILLVLGTLIIGVLLAFMGTGLKAGQAHEERTLELYAADAGIESALWKIKHDQVPSDPYQLVVNAKGVEVVITTQTGEEWLAELLGENIHHGPHADWMVISGLPAPGVFTIEITYTGSAQNKKIDGLGAWLKGDYDYVEGSAHGITDDYPQYSFEFKPHATGTAFIWEWKSADRPVFTQGDTKYHTFEFEPADTPEMSLAWVLAGSNDIWLSWQGEFMTGEITATATDSATGKWTKVVANVVREGSGVPYDVSIFSWEINPTE